MKIAKPDDEVVYFSEPRLRGGPPGGPYPARVIAVDAETETADLSVEVSPGVFKPKTRVPFALSPTKHCWSWPDPAPAAP